MGDGPLMDHAIKTTLGCIQAMVLRLDQHES